MADLYAQLNQTEDALRLRKEILEELEANYGSNHAEVLEAMISLAFTYNLLALDDKAHHDKALPLFEHVLERYRITKPSNHPDLLFAMENLRDTYLALDRKRDARRLSEEILPLQEAEIGEARKNNLPGISLWLALNKLKSTYSALDRDSDADALGEEMSSAFSAFAATMRLLWEEPESPEETP